MKMKERWRKIYMALINCPECNQQISDKAAFCPRCGFPVAEISKNTGTNDEHNSYNVILQSALGNQIKVIKGLRNMFPLGLVEAKNTVDNAPCIIKRDISLDEANKIKHELVLCGAKVAITPYDEKQDEASLLKMYTINALLCPRCGSTAITTGQRGFSIISGFLGSNKTVNRCGKCGYSWEPK